MKTLKTHQWAAIIVAVIVALADAVIVYDLHLSGAWLSPSWLSWLKTSAFVFLFIGSLIAEMQDLRMGTRLLLLGAVVLLGAYQAGVNIIVNYHAANIPTTALALFDGWLAPLQVKLWYSIIDGAVRTLVVVLMWLVTGLVWRGVATGVGMDTVPNEAAQEQLAEMQERLVEVQATLEMAQYFRDLEPRLQVRWIIQNRNGKPTNSELARLYEVDPATIGRWGKAD